MSASITMHQSGGLKEISTLNFQVLVCLAFVLLHLSCVLQMSSSGALITSLVLSLALPYFVPDKMNSFGL